MEKIEEKVKNHIHCSWCLQGILEEKTSTTIYPEDEDAPRSFIYIYKCGSCGRMFKKVIKNDGITIAEVKN